MSVLSGEACLDDSVTVVAELPVELVVVLGTVGQASPLIVSVAPERFLTFGADKVGLPYGSDDPVLYWSPAGPTDWDVHLVVAPQTVQLVHLLTECSTPSPRSGPKFC